MEVTDVIYLKNEEDDRIVQVAITKDQMLELMTFAINDLIIRGVVSIKEGVQNTAQVQTVQ